MDVYGDGSEVQWVDQKWIEEKLSTVNEFQSQRNQPIAVNEFGVMRWADGGHHYLTHQMEGFEKRGMNHAIWLWESSWKGVSWSSFNYRKGPHPNQKEDVSQSEILTTLKKFWARNGVTPSDVRGRW